HFHLRHGDPVDRRTTGNRSRAVEGGLHCCPAFAATRTTTVFDVKTQPRVSRDSTSRNGRRRIVAASCLPRLAPKSLPHSLVNLSRYFLRRRVVLVSPRQGQPHHRKPRL
ncbi:unnamed protein product, partial [Ectocarpus fasciculatus]